MSGPDQIDRNDAARARLARVADLFAEAMELEPETHAGWLAELAQTEPEVAAELGSLLAAHDAAGGFLADSPMSALLPPTDSGTDAGEDAGTDAGTAADDLVGPYRIEEELGRGGMGVVYVAARADGQFEQRVALKLIRRGMASELLRERFLTERQILAQLDHLHIARLLDGGITDDGQPWFAMEYIEGRPLDEYCESHSLDIEARLSLFLDVCEAVQHAHSKLIVHRDLKPNNILVTADGTVKLLDFGIAKLLDLDGTGAETRLTELGLRPLTPEYAAPEQVRGDPATTAVDVYALGALLYELLCGELPLALNTRDPVAVARVICDTQPTPPSRTRRLTQKHARRLRGDLDDIVMKALRKEPERRYDSVDRLAEDVRRHLDGLPVRARPDSLGYRAGKFVVRHRLGVAAAAGMLSLLLAGLAATAWQARIAADQRDRARQEAAKAEQVKELWIGLFENADPSVAMGEELTARELLDGAVVQVRAELADQPEVQAELLNTLGTVYRSLGRYEQAGEVLSVALQFRRALYPAGHEDLATTLNDLATVFHFRGEYDQARPLYEEALAMRRTRLGERHAAVAETINDLGVLLYQDGDVQGAEPLYREAFEMRREILGDAHEHTLTSELNLGGLLLGKSENRAAAEVLTRNVEGWRRLRDDRHPDVADAQAALARAHMRLGDYEIAEGLIQDALAIRRRVHVEAHPSIASSLNTLASLKSHQGDYVAAERLMRETLAIDRELLGEEHPYIAGDIERLGEAIAQQGRMAPAIELFEEALTLSRKVRAPDHPSTASCLLRYADALAHAGRPEAAMPLIDEALGIMERKLGVDHVDYARALTTRALVLQGLGDADGARDVYQAALARQRELLDADDLTMATTMFGLASVQLDAGEAAQAAALLAEAGAIRERRLPAGHWRIAEVRELQARLAALSPDPAR